MGMPTVRALLLAVLAAPLAGCAGPGSVDQEYHDTLGAGDEKTYTFSFDIPVQLSYDLDAIAGRMSIYVMDGREADDFRRGEGFEAYGEASHENVESANDNIDVSAGDYAIGLRCENTLGSCEYRLRVEA